MNPVRWWKDLSVSKKLYGVVGVMAVLIALELFTLIFAMDILSAVRAFVAGEGMWSKAQKNAILEIQSYVLSREEQHYQAFLENLKVQAGDRKARLELQKPVMNVGIVYEGFIEGRNHPKDLPAMVNLIRRFHRVSYLARAINAWTEADSLMDELVDLSHQIRHVILHAKPNQTLPELGVFLTRIRDINEEITILEDQFSNALGEGSRWLENTLMMILFIAVFTVESTGLYLTFRFSRNLTTALRELNSAAEQIGQGNFEVIVPERSKDELGQLATSLNRMSRNLRDITGERAQAEEASQVKSLFLANMSHEIRTPLGAMLGFIELLRDPGISEKEKKKYLDIISRTGDTLVTIINDILDISKVEAGKIEIHKENCSLPQLLGDLEVLLRLRCEGKGIYLRFYAIGDVPSVIHTDPMRLRQILMNIIGNAIKFTNRGGVTVSYQVRGDQLVFSVKDTGMGIAKEDIGKLFKPFSQGDISIRKSHGGTGLGLTLSRKLARFLGGDVVLENSEKGLGSTFTIQVALEHQVGEFSPAKPAPAPEEVRLEGALDGLRILLVEDAPENQMLISHFLSKSGAKVEMAANGVEGVHMATTHRYDLILMDMQMPILDGYSATAELRRMGFSHPIIALTAHAMKENLDRCFEVGCDDVLTKPVRRAQLIGTILKYIRKSV